MRVTVTGASGRLGRALLAALEDAPFTGPFGPIAWSRPDYDLDDPAAAARLLRRDRPEVVIHAAAWTDVDGCARDPEHARRRNADAVAALASACRDAGADLILVSTNEVFDGRRPDSRGYRPGDPTRPINAYGASKLAGEDAARAAFGIAPGLATWPAGSPSLAIVRTAWLFGPPGNDFPAKILAAASRAADRDEPLRVVADEFGSPTYSVDLAEAIVDLLWQGSVSGVLHVVNAGMASRADWAEELLRQAGRDVSLERVPASTWPRASTPPAWAVLEPAPLPSGDALRPWQAALADYLPALLRAPDLGGPV